MIEIRLDELDLTHIVRPGDTVVWPQASAEPVALTSRLMAQRHTVGPFTALIGLQHSDTVKPIHADVVRFVSYCGSGDNRELEGAGVLDFLPTHYSELCAGLVSGGIAADVVFVVATPDPAGPGYRLSLADEYVGPAIGGARAVVVEVNDLAPHSPGGRYLRPEDIDIVVHTSRPPVAVETREPSAVDLTIGDYVATVVPDGATLQFGLGRLPSAILRRLSGHADLGVHSGILTDVVADLTEAGVITNDRKTVDRGQTVGGLLMGTARLFGFANGNKDVVLRGTDHTHDPAVLAAQERFVAINSAFEVDLTGQVNAEVAGGRYWGAVGGASDFLRGAAGSPGGIGIIALNSTAGPRSRVVAGLSGPVSTARADVGLVITEYGIADLRGLSVAERVAQMIPLAHPDHRAGLIAAVGGDHVLHGAGHRHAVATT